MSDRLDTNIDNYSKEELLEIIGFSKDDMPTKQQVTTMFNKLIQKYSLDKNIRYANFFTQARNKVIHNVELEKEIESEIPQAEKWLQHQFLQQENKNQNNMITQRRNTVQILDNETNPVMHREHLGVSNTVPLEIGQDSLNPVLRQLTRKFITIDSQYRQHIIPYSSDPNSPSSSTNFTCTLTDTQKNVVSLKLNSVFIPRTWYTFDRYLNNTCFWVYYDYSFNSLYNNIKLDDVSKVSINIDDGNYTPSNLISHISNKLHTKKHNIPDLSGLDISYTGFTSNIIAKFINKNTYMYYKIVFYNPNLSLFCQDNSHCSINMRYDQNLGYHLGFRITQDDLINYEDIIREDPYMQPELSIILHPSGSGINTQMQSAQVPINVNGPQYFSLIIDDFNYSHSNNGGVTIQGRQTKLSIPSYFNRLDISSSKCIDNPNPNNRTLYVPTFPRKLTQNQLYALNEIMANRKESNERTTSFNNSNNFAHISIPSESSPTEMKNISYTNLSSQPSNERKYFGPVSIERLHISLYDDRGNIVNLHGHDWSFTLIAEELYQY